MYIDLAREIQQLHKKGRYLQIVRRLSWHSYDQLPQDMDTSIVMKAIIRTLRSAAEEEDIEKAARLVWQLELQGLLTRNDVEQIRQAVGEDLPKAKDLTPFFLGSIGVNHELQKFHEEGQYLQIVQRLYTLHELPAGIDVPIVLEALLHMFHSSSKEEELWQADVVTVILEKHLTRNDLDRIFDAVGKAILNTQGEIPLPLSSALISSYNEEAPEHLIGIYVRAKTPEAKIELASEIGSACKEKGLLVLVENLYSQQLIGNDSIRAILEKHSLLSDVHLEPQECEAIISAVLDFLKIPGPRIGTPEEEKKFEKVSINRTSAARILVVLHAYPNTPEGSRAKIHTEADLLVIYFCTDRMYDVFEAIPLSSYLSGLIK
jgi:hypothetical protein